MTPIANSNRSAPVKVQRIKKNPVKLTALLYLKEAVLEERYEDCAEFIGVAREFGAEPFEIRNILEDARRPVKE